MEVTAEAKERANELYWGSDRSVNQIADELDLSKGALYSAIEPMASGSGCPLCGAETVFSNRTAKERNRLDCPTCEWDGSPDETTTYERAHSVASADDLPALPPPRSAASGPPVSTILGGALLGAAVGLALVIWARRR